MKLDKLNELIRAKNDIEALKAFKYQLKANDGIAKFGIVSVQLPPWAVMKISVVFEEQIKELEEMIENA